ncbi:hypothetical protein RvY_01534 [Ramazzottius varieornatus]|uniref:Mitochondrial import receptor subunit TOM70 n=1 Tax=Ramazzottius varieornatus TaxID=947166 RepID=A0A1D1UHI3_RAMVA|nr:hypothetical protein RvY_01534 [Ramazzottius varieornatus]
MSKIPVRPRIAVAAPAVPALPPPLLPLPSLPDFADIDPAWTWGSPNTWPKWLIGLLIGVPLVAGGAYWMYRSQNKPARSIDGSKKRTTPNGSALRGAGDASQVSSGISTGTSSPLPLSLEGKSVTETITMLKNEGNKLFRARRYNEAKQLYSQAITAARQNGIRDDLAQSLQNRAACNEQLKLYEDVRDDCSAALEIDGRYAKAYYRRSRALEKLDKPVQAAHDMIAASILTNFQNAEYRDKSERLVRDLAIKLARTEMEEKKKRPMTTRKLSKVFVRQFNHGFSRDPILEAVSKVNADGNGSADLVEDALWAFSRGEYCQVIDFCNEALLTISSDDRHVMARLLRGTMFFLFGDVTSAKPDFVYVIDAPNAPFAERTNARVKLACLYLQESIDPSEVINRLNDAEAKDPINPDIFFHRAQCNMLFGRFDDCLNDLRKCERLKDDSDSTTAFHIAHIEYRLKANQHPSDEQPLIELENKLTTLNLPEGYVLLGQLFMEKNEHDKAYRFLSRAIGQKSDVHNAVVYTQLGLLEMLWREDRFAARSSLQKAIALDPYYTQALELLMDLDIQAGNLVHAREIYELCVDLAKSEMELVPLIQAYQIGEAGHVVYAQLGIDEGAHNPLPFGMPPDV